MKEPMRTALFVIILLLLFASCPVNLRENDSLITISVVVPERPRPLDSSARAVPAGIEDLYIQLVDGSAVLFSEQVEAVYGSVLNIVAEVPVGTFDLHAFALGSGCIIGIAAQENVTTVAGQTTAVSLTMSELIFEEPSAQSGLGYANPVERTLGASIGGIPESFAQYVGTGTAYLYGRLNADPAAWDDRDVTFDASASFAEGSVSVEGELPAGTAEGGDELRYWFAVRWPGCPAVLTNALPSQVSSLVFDGGTLSGNLYGTSYGANPGDYPEAAATVELQQTAVTIQDTVTDAEGDYLFGDVAAGVYNVVLTSFNLIEFQGYVDSTQSSLNGAAFSSGSTSPTYNYDPPNTTLVITYTSLTIASSAVVTLDFHFQGY